MCLCNVNVHLTHALAFQGITREVTGELQPYWLRTNKLIYREDQLEQRLCNVTRKEQSTSMSNETEIR